MKPMEPGRLKLDTARGIFHIRPYENGDETGILSSWRRAFKSEMPAEHWRWKYPGNPQGFRCLLCVAEDGTVVIHYAAQVMKILMKERIISGLHITDSFSHPGFRWAIGGKSGLFIKAGWAFLNTYLERIETIGKIKLAAALPPAQFHYGFPGERHNRLGAKLLNYRLHRPGVIYMRRQPRAQSLFSPASISCGMESFPGELIPGRETDEIWQDFKKAFSPFCTVRDFRFIRWRFGERPDKKYTFYILRHRLSGRPAAWLVTDSSDEKVITVVDFLARSNDALAQLLKRAGERERGMETWLSGNHPLKEAFERAGFFPRPEPLGIIPNTRCDMLAPEIVPDDADEFFFTMADGDLF